MEKLIKKTLDKLYNDILNSGDLPTKKVSYKSIDIMDVEPYKLSEFLKANNVPENAVFEGVCNSYDACEEFVVTWGVEVPINEQDLNSYIKQAFEKKVYNELRKLFLHNGYKRFMDWIA